MTLDFNKTADGLLPAIIQDVNTRQVLMLGYMNAEALTVTETTGWVTFFSRSKQRLWTKGESSGNRLKLISIKVDCDQDTLLVRVEPQGPTCHTGSESCWDETNSPHFGFLSNLEATIAARKAMPPQTNSYVAGLFQAGINKVAQKVGEEAVETVIEAVANNKTLFLEEAADLLFHYMILLQAKNLTLSDIIAVLEARQK